MTKSHGNAALGLARCMAKAFGGVAVRTSNGGAAIIRKPAKNKGKSSTKVS